MIFTVKIRFLLVKMFFVDTNLQGKRYSIHLCYELFKASPRVQGERRLGWLEKSVGRSLQVAALCPMDDLVALALLIGKAAVRRRGKRRKKEEKVDGLWVYFRVFWAFNSPLGLYFVLNWLKYNMEPCSAGLLFEPK